ncbi:e3 ubiquitin-protein ligase RNF126 [Caerostris extrusa]|uniref:RING-type E3 ubiquitin transferase n=1 Tax=Caerostris extrusa TaxID=172846 RepID=A0AAV4N340_CAEEX|nr:e3 ubiquitin-protein ligase RNF126 [Caerostris extrusa]
MDSRDVVQQGNMAEAAVESPVARFFCHKCSLEINPVLPDYTCPRCQGGFIEEVAQASTEASHSADGIDDVDPFSQVNDLYSMLNYLRRSDAPPIISGSTFVAQDGREPRYMMSRPGPSRRSRYIRVPSRRPNPDSDNTAQSRLRTEGFLQQLISTLSENTGTIKNVNIVDFSINSPMTRRSISRLLAIRMVANAASFPVFLNLHSNPGDYAWGRGGWNAIITQLINQLDGTGPPPLPKEKIDEIPTVNICQEQVDKNLQCTVCMEDFQQGEPVRRLACDHHYHDNCIIPWLELHGTCPICRKLLNDGSNQENSSSDTAHPGTSQQLNDIDMSEPDDMPRRSDSYNPHLPSVYDFTEEFD